MPKKVHIHRIDNHPLDAAHTEDKTAHHHDNGEKHHSVDKAKDSPGIICIERHIHDDAIVISGTLTIEYGAADLNSLIAGELEKAARAIKEHEGIIGHIKAAVTVTSTDVISITDDDAMVTVSPLGRARIALAAIVFMIEPKEAETLMRKALAGVRTALRSVKNNAAPADTAP